jgi:hypothetical protein
MKRTLVCAVAAALLLATPAADAQTAERGTTTLALTGAGAKALTRAGVTVRATKPARRTRTWVAFPVARGSIGASAWLEHDGAITFRRRGRSVRFADLRVTTRGAVTRLSAQAPGGRLTLVTARRRTTLDRTRGTAALRATRATLSVKAARLLGRRLGLRTVRRAIGTLTIQAALGAGEGTPSNKPITSEPPVLRRPGTAGAVGAAAMTWHVRESFIRYIAQAEGTSAKDGARGGAPRKAQDGLGDPMVYDYAFTPLPERSWFDPVSSTAGLYFRGTVNFRYEERGIDIDVSDPEVELTGSRPRVIFRFPKSGNKRTVLLDLDLRAASADVAPDGTATYRRIPARVAPEAVETVFAGMYQAGTAFGSVTVSFKAG